MLATFSRPLTILSAALLLAAPVQAESTDDAEAERLIATSVAGNMTPVPEVTWDLSLVTDATGNLSVSIDTTGDLRMAAASTTEDTGSCQLVDYSLSKPTAITPDPDRCFIPYVLGKIPI